MDSLIYLDRYHLSMDSLKYLDRCHLSRYIKESIFIKVNKPTLNNNVGKFNLPHLWDRVVINTPGLKLNK